MAGKDARLGHLVLLGHRLDLSLLDPPVKPPQDPVHKSPGVLAPVAVGDLHRHLNKGGKGGGLVEHLVGGQAEDGEVGLGHLAEVPALHRLLKDAVHLLLVRLVPQKKPPGEGHPLLVQGVPVGVLLPAHLLQGVPQGLLQVHTPLGVGEEGPHGQFPRPPTHAPPAGTPPGPR